MFSQFRACRPIHEVRMTLTTPSFTLNSIEILHEFHCWISLVHFIVQSVICMQSFFSFSYSFTVVATVNNLVSSTDVVISLLSPFHVIYEFIEECWEQIPAQTPVERRAEIAPSPAKSKSGYAWFCTWHSWICSNFTVLFCYACECGIIVKIFVGMDNFICKIYCHSSSAGYL